MKVVRWKQLVEKYGKPMELQQSYPTHCGDGVVTIHSGETDDAAWYGEFGHTIVNVVTKVQFPGKLDVPTGPSIIVGIDMGDVIPAR